MSICRSYLDSLIHLKLLLDSREFLIVRKSAAILRLREKQDWKKHGHIGGTLDWGVKFIVAIMNYSLGSFCQI